MMTEKYQNLTKQILDVSQYDSLFSKFKFTEEDIQHINSFIARLEEVFQVFSQTKHVSAEEFYRAQNSCANQLLTSFERIANNQSLTSTITFESISEMQTPLNQLRLIRQVSIVGSKTAETYTEIVRKPKNFIQEVPREIAKHLNNGPRIPTYQIKHLLTMVSKNKWIDQFEQELSSRVLEDIQAEISNYYNRLKDDLISVLSDPDIEKWIQKAFKLFKRVDDMVCLENYLPKLEKNRQEIMKILSDKITSYLSQINQLLNQYNLVKSPETFQFEEGEKSQIEQFLRYLKAAKDIPQLVQEPFRIQSELKEVLKKIFKKYRYSLSQTFHKHQHFLTTYRESLVFGNLDDSHVQMSQVKERIEEICKCVTEVRDMQSSYPNLYRVLDFQKQKLIEQWRKRLNQEFDEIDKNLNEFQVGSQIKKARIVLQFVETLQKFDEVCLETSYKAMLQRHHKNFCTMIKEQEEKTMGAIKAGEDEDTVQSMIEDFQVHHEENRFGRIINCENTFKKLQRERQLYIKSFFKRKREFSFFIT